MKMRIICAVDLSNSSNDVINRAKRIVQAIKGWLTLIHCIEKQQMDLLTFILKTNENAKLAIDSQAQSHLSMLKQQFSNPNDVCIEIETGQTADCVSRIALESQADMTILGASDKSGLQRVFLGSNALKILRRSSCPVLVVKNKAENDYQRILIGVDLSRDITDTVHFLNLLAPEAELVFVHCYEIPFEGKLNHHAEVNDVNLKAYRTEIREEALKKMQTIIDKSDLNPLKFSTIVIQGNPADTLMQLAIDHDCDLIVLNKNNQTTIDEWLLGSVTNEVTNSSTKDILILDIKRIVS